MHSLISAKSLERPLKSTIDWLAVASHFCLTTNSIICLIKAACDYENLINVDNDIKHLFEFENPKDKMLTSHSLVIHV